MKPIQLNEQQIEALSNGATKLWLPIDVPLDPEIVSQLVYQQTVGSVAIFRHEGISISVPLSPQPNEQYFCMTDTHLIFTTTGVKVKHVQDDTINWYEVNPAMSIPHIGHDWNNITDWHDSQYPDQPYSTNPIGFLVSIERINDER